MFHHNYNKLSESITKTEKEIYDSDETNDLPSTFRSILLPRRKWGELSIHSSPLSRTQTFLLRQPGGKIHCIHVNSDDLPEQPKVKKIFLTGSEQMSNEVNVSVPGFSSILVPKVGTSTSVKSSSKSILKKTFPTPIIASSYSVEVFKTESPVKEEHCDKVDQEKVSKSRGRRKSKKVLSFSCSVCDRAFKVKSNLHKHLLVHTDEKPFNCNLCGKMFKSMSTLRKHSLLHAGEKPYPCSQCDRTFIQKASLRMHFRQHTGEKPFACSLCNKKFTAKSGLKSHLLYHTGEKPYACDKCDRKFRFKSSLHGHMVFHTGVKQFTCDTCGKKFTHKLGWQKHSLLHTGEKPHACDTCGRRFTVRSNLLRHLLTHTTDNPRARRFQTKRRRTKTKKMNL